MQGLLLAGRYRLADSIGSGGMGRVWRAHDEVLHRAVAIKELTAALYVSESDQAVLLARTRAEARAAARINHSAVVTVHDVLEHDNRPWIVMELVEGRSLADAVKERGRLEPTEAARVGLWVLRALRAAHAAGVLHRDVKPGNVLLADDGRVLLTDFGIAQIEGDTTITRTGEVVGSVDYLAPERVRGHDPGPASDLWALGATLYSAVEGLSPFRRTSPLTTMQAVVDEEPAEMRHAGPLGPVVTALLRKDPAARPDAATAEEMLAEAAGGRHPHAAQAGIPPQGSGLHTGGPSTPGYSTTGPTSGYGTASGHGTASGYGTTSGYGTSSGSGFMGAGHGPGAPGGPGRSRSGPTAVAPVPRGPAPVRSGPRRRLRTLALVVTAAAVLGGGAAVAFQEWGGMEQNTRSSSGAVPATSSPSASGSATPGGAGSLPAGWEQHHDPVGFSIFLPKGWKRSVSIDQDGIRQVDYSPDRGKHLVRIAVDTAPDFRTAYEHMSNLDQRLARRLRDYKTLSLKDELFRDQPGVRWEYTWDALATDPPHYFPGLYHAIDVAYMESDGTEYALYAASPADDWATTSKQFDWILRSFQEG
ncbi:serine/threonine-protein kinase [Streptomyces mexicanus]|uniref:non-specific serine/threonine protein kinase n=1 Tax=Streptomyces mexicanus TaxID=178566 RepID=A0A7X1HVZ3_9ACTN|nr:serine/threonine-protein kinase [Streptomyces mexicanus]MBC2864150.1 serine/threonine protein kinase [Streptomyces mexicanus]